jgi:hypothetical protein
VLSLRAGRVLIEPLGEGDVAAFTAYRRSPDVARWQTWDTGYDEADWFKGEWTTLDGYAVLAREHDATP